MTKKNDNEHTDPGNDHKRRFVPEDLDWSIIARPLQEILDKADDNDLIDVVIDLNFKYDGGLTAAKDRTIDLIHDIESELIAKGEIEDDKEIQRVKRAKKEFSQQYLFASLEKRIIREIAKRGFYKEQEQEQEKEREKELDAKHKKLGEEALPFIHRPVFMFWPDFKVRALTLKSISTIKADAAHNAFSAKGGDIVWAVLDSGIDGDHPHFARHKNLSIENLDPPLKHRDFTEPPAHHQAEYGKLTKKLEDLRAREAKLRIDEQGRQNIEKLNAVMVQIRAMEAAILKLERDTALTDELGHGTHVAGIIAGELRAEDLKINRNRKDSNGIEAGEEKLQLLRASTRHRNELGDTKYRTFEFDRISGMAPKCKLVSIKILDANGEGPVSNLLAAIAEIQEINEHGRWLKIHGVNLSVGYDFEPEWFACGQSPLCVEVDRLVKSGVVVVTAAGNTGFGYKETASSRGVVASGMMMSINDPGNADLAITVGSTHREMPHTYGVSFFSSKGPTGDGRLKPDLVAPGERIISCAAGKNKDAVARELELDNPPEYSEDSGTSMAAPHVSGAIAAFLSIRREFIGKPELVKQMFVSSATDLKRERYLQGEGMVDLMRTIQSV